MIPPVGPVTFHTHDNATAVRGRTQSSATAEIDAKLEKRNFNCGSFSYQLAKRPASIFSLGFRAGVSYSRRL